MLLISIFLLLIYLFDTMSYNKFILSARRYFSLYISDNRPFWTDEFKLLTRNQLQIPPLHMMGHADFHTTFTKLDTHYHYTMEFVVILNGKQQYIVNDKQYILYGGDIFMTYPRERHGNGGLPQEVCEFIWFQLDMSSSRNFLGLMPSYSEYLFQHLLNYRQRIRKVPPKSLDILRQAFYQLSFEDPPCHLLGYSLFLQFLVNNLCAAETVSPEPSYSPDIQKSLNYIRTHLSENPALEAISAYCGLSPSRFKAKFRDQLGITPHAYIISLKIDAAKILLQDPKYSITDVAFQLDFASSNHFSTVFKKHTGFTPTAFRENHLASHS